jgi:hypothetical protein
MPRNVSFYGKSAAPLYGRQIERDYQTDPRRLMAESILQKGVGPVQSPTEGMLKALQQGVAGYFAGQARRDKESREERASQGLLAALQGGQARPWVNPGAEADFAPPGTVATARGPGGMVEGLAPVAGGSEYQQPPAGALPASPVGEESTAPAGGYEGIMAALLAQNNPDLAPFAQQLAMGQMEQQAAQRQAEIARAQALQDMELKHKYKLAENAASRENGSLETWGKNPVWGTGPNGEQVLGVMSNYGNFKQVDTGDFAPERRGLTSQTLGDKIIWTDSTGRVVHERKIEYAPGQSPTEARKVAAAKASGEQAVEASGDAFESLAKVNTNIANIDDAIAAIDAGAQTGAVQSFLPSVRASSVALDNVQRRMGLDVIGAVTFGALSKGELDLALDTALPTKLGPLELKKWLIDKKTAQQKLAKYLDEAAIYLGTPGNTRAGWAKKRKEEAADQQTPVGSSAIDDAKLLDKYAPLNTPQPLNIPQPYLEIQ